MSGSTSIGNDQRKGTKPNDPPPDDKSTLLPGDEMLPGTVSTGEDRCRCCGGSGKMPGGAECKDCRGTGKTAAKSAGA